VNAHSGGRAVHLDSRDVALHRTAARDHLVEFAKNCVILPLDPIQGAQDDAFWFV
jgi:hypothetical protein